VILEPKEISVLPDSQDIPDPLEKQALQVKPDRPVQQDLLDTQEPKEEPELHRILVQQDLQGQLVLLELKVKLEPRPILEQQVQLVKQDLLDLPEPKEKQELTELQVIQELPDPLDPPEKQDQPVQMVKQDLPALLV
jgi:hypothetical protein